MSATSGRVIIKSGELDGTLDGKGNAIINADLSGLIIPEVNVPTIASTTTVLKGDNAGNAVAATAKTDFWNTDVFVASGASHAKGLVPDPGASAATTKFLREDATWATPPGAQTVPTIASTTVVLKGDNAGNAVAATAKTDFWDGTVFVASGTNHAKGLVPDPGASAGTTKYLREDGTFAVPPASSGVVIASTTLVIKGDNAGGGVAATPGTDYVVPSTALTRLLAGTTVLSGATPTVNFNLTTSFSQTLAANTTYTFSNTADGYDVTLAITNTASNYTVTWPAGIKWTGGSPPTQTVGAKTDIYGFKVVGSTIYGAYVQNLS